MLAVDPRVPELDVLRGAVDHAARASLCAAVCDEDFQLAPVRLAEGPRVDPATRSNDRAVVRSASLASLVFDAVGAALPSVVHGRQLVGLTSLLRYYRYREGQRFAPHRDGVEHEPDGPSSLLTLLVGLAKPTRGGATHFLRSQRRVLLDDGDVLWFQHGLLHEGCVVDAGEKLVVRLDALYAR